MISIIGVTFIMAVTVIIDRGNSMPIVRVIKDDAPVRQSDPSNRRSIVVEFDGEFELEGVPPEKAWIVLSDPIAVRNSLKGCRYITPMDDEFSFDEYEPDEGAETLPEADPRSSPIAPSGRGATPR